MHSASPCAITRLLLVQLFFNCMQIHAITYTNHSTIYIIHLNTYMNTITLTSSSKIQSPFLSAFRNGPSLHLNAIFFLLSTGRSDPNRSLISYQTQNTTFTIIITIDQMFNFLKVSIQSTVHYTWNLMVKFNLLHF